MFKNGYLKSDINSFTNENLKNGFELFLKQQSSYKEQFSQKKYNYGFDGYSFLGQEDSSNQYATDLLHSFVISDFRDANLFPKEFQHFFSLEWIALQKKIKELEISILKELQIPGLNKFYVENIGHMISCNYYPKTEMYDFTAKNKTRLSAHTDVSLFTIFPFGFDRDFYYEDANKNWVQIEATNKIVIFPGYLLELHSQGRIKALNHCVKMPEKRNTERFSFAYFSLPYPKHSFKIADQDFTSEQYFEKYLNLF